MTAMIADSNVVFDLATERAYDAGMSMTLFGQQLLKDEYLTRLAHARTLFDTFVWQDAEGRIGFHNAVLTGFSQSFVGKMPDLAPFTVPVDKNKPAYIIVAASDREPQVYIFKQGTMYTGQIDVALAH